MLFNNYEQERNKIIEKGLDKPQKDNALYIKGSTSRLIINGHSYSAQVEAYFFTEDQIRFISTKMPEEIGIEFLLKGKKKALLTIETEYDKEAYAIGYGEQNSLNFIFFIKANGKHYWLTSKSEDDAYQMLEIEDELMDTISPILDLIRTRLGERNE